MQHGTADDSGPSRASPVVDGSDDLSLVVTAGQPAADATGAPAGSRLGVWAHRDLRLVAGGRAVSVLGDEVATVALVLHAYDRGWGTPGVAAIFVAATLPWALVMPLAGRWADRVDSRRTTVVSGLVQALGCAAMLALVLLPGDPVAAAAGVVASLFLVTSAQAVANPAWNALLPHTVPDAQVSRAVSAVQTLTSLAFVVGPGLGGLLAGGLGVAWALALDLVTFVVVVLVAATVRTVRRPDPSAGGDSVWAGLTTIRDDRLLATLLGGIIVILVVVQVVLVVDVFLVRDVFGAGAGAYGLVGGAISVGSLAGAALAGRFGTVGAQARAISAALVGISVLCVAAGLAPALVLAAVALAGIGVGFGVLNVAVGSLVVGRTPDEVRGRVYSAVAGTTQGATVAGLGLAAVLGGQVSPRTAFVVSGAAGLVVCAGVVPVVARALRQEPAPA